MKKILILNYEFPPLGGGAGNATQNIAREFARMGHEVVVLTTWFVGTKEDEIADGYRVVRVRSKRARVDRSDVLEMLHFVYRAITDGRDLVNEFKPDVTISFFAIPSGIVAWYFKKKFGVPYILSLRGGDVPGFLPKDLRYWHILSYPFTALVWKNARKIVANSDGLWVLAKKTAKRFDKEVEVIPNGVNIEEFAPSAQRNVSAFRVLFVGRLVRQKGVSFLLNAVAKALTEHPSWRGVLFCDIVGDGPLRGDLEKLSDDLGIRDVVRFYGWASREELPALYQQANIFVLPSFDEGMPNVILEAIASGLPVIATDIKGNEELVEGGKNGFLYREQEDLARLLVQMISDPARAATMGECSREKSKEYSWSSVARSYVNLLDHE